MEEHITDRHLNAIVESISDPLLVISKEYEIVFMNKAAKSMYGDCLYESKKSHCYVVTHGNDRHCSELGETCPVKEVFETGKTIRAAHKHNSTDGSTTAHEITATPIVNEQGEVVEVVEVVRDVTESFLFEKLAVKHEKMKKLFMYVENAKREWEHSMDCVSDIVIVTKENGEILRANKPINLIVDRPFLEILGRNWNELLLENGMEQSGEFEGDDEFYHRHLDKYYTVRVHQVTSPQSETAQAVTLHDITERKLITAELEKQHQELEDAYTELKVTQSKILQQEKMASIGQLAAGVAHEINNPVGFITSNIGSLAKYVDKLQDFIEAQSAVIENYENFLATDELINLRKKLKIDFILEDVKDLIKESLEGTDRVKTIVQNLKNFSRVDQTEHSMTNLNECVESTLNIVWNELKYKTTVNKEYGEIPLTYCYPQQLNQVFMNLLVNGAQAIKEKGEIDIKTWSKNDFIYVSIADSGCGIPEENLSKLFEPFFTTKEVGKGTGLGLSIAYDIVTKKHDGELLVESEVDKGTTFTVKIPVVKRGDDE